MVNFNFGLGGLVGKNDDDKQDEATTASTGDDSSIQDDSTTAQNNSSTQNSETNVQQTPDESVAAGDSSMDDENSSKEEVQVANEPVFDGNVQTVDSEENQSEESNTEGNTQNFAENLEENTAGGLTTQNNEEEWLNDPNEKTEPVSLETETESMPTLGEATGTTENNEVFETETATQTTPTTVGSENEEANSLESVDENPANLAGDVSNTPEIPTFGNPPTAVDDSTTETNETAENFAENSESTKNPFPAGAVPVTNNIEEVSSVDSTEDSSLKNQTVLPKIPKNESNSFENSEEEDLTSSTKENPANLAGDVSNTPEIPTFGNPSTAVDDFTTETTDETAGNFAENSESPMSETDNSDLFATSDEPLAEDPLAPAAVGVIGAPEPEEQVIADGSFNDEDNNEKEEINSLENKNPAKNIESPASILEEYKKRVEKFEEFHNSKIEEYNQKIAEFRAKIREEKKILKEEMKKSEKILGDLNNLVLNFTETKPIKKKVTKKIGSKIIKH